MSYPQSHGQGQQRPRGEIFGQQQPSHGDSATSASRRNVRHSVNLYDGCSRVVLILTFLRQATELCGEKAADLQTTLIHLQWQSKHVEQRLMAERATRELDIAVATAATATAKPDENKLSTAAAAAAASGASATQGDVSPRPSVSAPLSR